MVYDNDYFGQEGAFFVWKPAAWLRISGEDALTFLQGQFTNELRQSSQGDGGVYGLWLNHKGRVLADSFVSRVGASEFWVGSYFSSAATIRDRLEAYVIADDVTIEDRTSECAGVTLIGAAVARFANFADGFNAVSFAGRRANTPAREWVFATKHLENAKTRLAALAEADAAAMDRVRIESGIPAVPADLGAGELPNEGGLDRDGISYTKGCYLGQEVMARLRSMGQVRRQLMRVTGAGAFPALPAPLFQGERRVGELRTASPAKTGFVGLALLSLLNLRTAEPLAFSPGGESVMTLGRPT